MPEMRWVPVLGAVVLAAGSACAAQQQTGVKGQPKDIGTPIILVPSGEPETCTIKYKQDVITSYPDKFVIFDVSNYCTDEHAVMVGNFRAAEAPSQTFSDCTRAVDPAEPDRIFVNDNEKQRTARVRGQNKAGEPGREYIKLGIKPNDELPPGTTFSKYFDVCLNNAISQDPRLIIER